MNDLAITIAVYAALGAVYGTSGYAKNVINDEREFDPVHFGSTVLIGAIAGGVVAIQGDELEAGTLEAVMAGLVPIADQIGNAIKE